MSTLLSGKMQILTMVDGADVCYRAQGHLLQTCGIEKEIYAVLWTVTSFASLWTLMCS